MMHGVRLLQVAWLAFHLIGAILLALDETAAVQARRR